LSEANRRRSLRAKAATKMPKTTPCKVAGDRLHGCFERSREKHFDTSGKSAALFHHRVIRKLPKALPNNGRFGAIAGKKSLPTIEVAPATPRFVIRRST